MTYKLAFTVSAKKDWDKLDGSIKQQFKKQFEKILQNPHIPKNRLSGQQDFVYKIKLKSVAYRLIYKVEDQKILVIVIALGKRDTVYSNLN